jgi:hypothetical protein
MVWALSSVEYWQRKCPGGCAHDSCISLCLILLLVEIVVLLDNHTHLCRGYRSRDIRPSLEACARQHQTEATRRRLSRRRPHPCRVQSHPPSSHLGLCQSSYNLAHRGSSYFQICLGRGDISMDFGPGSCNASERYRCHGNLLLVGMERCQAPHRPKYATEIAFRSPFDRIYSQCTSSSTSLSLVSTLQCSSSGLLPPKLHS